MAHKSDAELVQRSRNTARFFVETRQLSWVLLIGTALWGVYAYDSMPQRKDPEISVRVAAALCPWPGADAEKVEQLVTQAMEEAIAQNQRVERITSNTRTGVAVVQVQLVEGVRDVGKEFDDINLKLEAIQDDLPEGAGPIQFIKDFGDTATLMLTVATPRVSDVEVALRARTIRAAVERTRAGAPPSPPGSRFAIVIDFPLSLEPKAVRSTMELFGRYLEQQRAGREVRVFEGPGFVGVDAEGTLDDAAIQSYGNQFVRERLVASEFHPDSWAPVVIRDPEESEARLASSAGEKYSYRELDDITELMQRTLQTLPIVSKVTRSGILAENVYLEYSQERLASYGMQVTKLPDLLRARNITLPGGILEVAGKSVTIDPSGEFKDEREIGDVLVPASGGAQPIYLRDLVTIIRGYQSPPRFLNFYTWRDEKGNWHRNRAVTLAIQMRSGGQIGEFAQAVDAALEDLRQRLPEDLIIARTSDQPLQVEESVHLFMQSLYEAIGLVVLVSLVGFWEWRSALLMALSIPITLAMTFGIVHLLGIDLQQVSIASLIIALGLLVDDPVVAGDAIKRELAGGQPPVVAAWLGPVKLATAILFATITNIVAYLPFLMLSGDTGNFLYSLPVVVGSALIASRIVSMTFIPLLGYYLLKPTPETPIEERRQKGFAGFYYRVGTWAIEHRWKVGLSSLAVLAVGVVIGSQLRTQFFPKDLSYLSYVDVWLPEDAPLSATGRAAARAEEVIREVVQDYDKEHPAEDGQPYLKSLTTFVGGGGPRFWSSVVPELQQLNYAQIIIQVDDKHATAHLVGPMQRALSAAVPGARIDVRQLETGKPVGIPVALRISGENQQTLRQLAAEAKAIFRELPTTTRVRDDWGDETLSVRLETDPDRANLSGVTNLDVAASSATGINGYPVTTLHEGDKRIPVLARLRMEERAQLADVQNLYVYAREGRQKVPLGSVSRVKLQARTEKIQRRNQFRTITVSAFPREGVLASEVMGAARAKLAAFQDGLPPGYRMEIGGEEEEQSKGFLELAIVLVISVSMIFLALAFQFQHAVKPFIVFAAIPYGMVGAVLALWVMGSPFGFMAFLGVASLVGVIVSHIIVLFDFIEEKHAEGEPLEQALLDAGIMRLRPVLITVGATVIALFPLAAHGGPLWEPLCFAQIGGLTAATVITLLLVPVFYSIFVLDLRLVHWHQTRSARGD